MTNRYHTLEKEVFDKFRQLDPVYTYHSFEHTETMLSLVEKYAHHEGITSKEQELLMIAILFHDLGFIIDWKGHEEIGANLAERSMEKLGYVAEDINTVRSIIAATKMPQEPQTKLEKIICDIDLDYLGRSDYSERSELLYKEWLALGVVQNRTDWEEREINFLKNHRYHTEYALQNRQPVLDELVKKMVR